MSMLPFGVVALGTPIFFGLGILTRNKLLFPIFPVLPLYYAFLSVVAQSIPLAFLLVCSWSLIQTALMLGSTFLRPEFMKKITWRSEQYTFTMFQWIQTGQLPEGRGRDVIIFHLKQALLYSLLAVLTANFLSLILGCALLNYMNYYVAQLMLKSSARVRALVYGWNPWSIIRVITFLWLGVLLSLPVLQQEAPSWILIAVAVAGLVIDAVLKLLMGRSWAEKLRLHVLS